MLSVLRCRVKVVLLALRPTPPVLSATLPLKLAGTVAARKELPLTGVVTVAVVGTVLSGWLTDKVNPRLLLAVYYTLRGASLFVLPQLFAPSADMTMLMFVIFYGLDWIATVPPTVKLTAQHFGPQKVGLVFGWIFAAHQLGAATAAWGAGLTRTLLLTYTPALYAAGLACLVAAVMALVIGRARKAAAVAAA